MACKASSNICLVCAAETQNLTRPVVRDVAGNPAPTAATPFLKAKRIKPLKILIN